MFSGRSSGRRMVIMTDIAEYSARLFVDRGRLRVALSKRVGNHASGKIFTVRNTPQCDSAPAHDRRGV